MRCPTQAACCVQRELACTHLSVLCLRIGLARSGRRPLCVTAAEAAAEAAAGKAGGVGQGESSHPHHVAAAAGAGGVGAAEPTGGLRTGGGTQRHNNLRI